MNLKPRPWLFAAVVATLTAPTALFAFAYEYPLSSSDIRDAYFIGRRNDEFTAEFFAKYAKHFTQPQTGPYVSQIDIDTPYTQIATHAANTANYDAPTAVQDYQDKPMLFYVHVQVFLTPTYTIAQLNDPKSI
jgi:hypothetical protein